MTLNATMKMAAGVWVCQFEFYGQTLTNQPGEDTRVLDRVP